MKASGMFALGLTQEVMPEGLFPEIEQPAAHCPGTEVDAVAETGFRGSKGPPHTEVHDIGAPLQPLRL